MSGYINDPMAHYFLPVELAWFIYQAPIYQKRAAMSFGVSRTIQGDRLVVNGKAKQIVLLGAGLDTRAHRLKVSKETKFYEVDIATTQEFKKKIASEHPKEFAGPVTYVPVDFSSEFFVDKLKQTPGFDIASANTVVLFEGVSMYLQWEDVKAALEGIAKNFPSGTLVGMDVMDDVFSTPDAIKRQKHFRGSKEAVDGVKRVGEPFQWGIPEGKTVQEIFQPLGYDVTHLSPEQIEKLFLTPPNEVKPVERTLNFFHYLILRVK